MTDAELAAIEADALTKYTAISPALSRQAGHTLKLAGKVRELLGEERNMRTQEMYLAVGQGSSPERAAEQAQERWGKFKEIVGDSIGAPPQDVDAYVRVEHAAPSLVFDGNTYTYMLTIAITYSYEQTEMIGGAAASPHAEARALLSRAAEMDGEHHKQWALVEACRLLGGTVGPDVEPGVPF